MRSRYRVILPALALAGCFHSESALAPGSPDGSAGDDASPDAEVDVGADRARDATLDAPVDVADDRPVDATEDGPIDAGSEAPVEPGAPDAEAGAEAGPAGSEAGLDASGEAAVEASAPDASGPNDAAVEAGPEAGANCIASIFGDHLVTTAGLVYRTGGSTTQSSWTPITVAATDGGAGPALDNVVAGMESQFSACALRGDGTVWCWATGYPGATSRGELGDGTLVWPSAVEIATQVQVAPPDGGGPSFLTGMTSLSVSSENTYGRPLCALDAAGHVWCWGPIYPNGGGSTLLINSVGMPASGGAPYAVKIAASSTPGDDLTGVTHLSVGDNQICVIVGNTQVRCWGSNIYGGLGTATADGGSVSDSNYPVVVPNLPASPPPSQIWTGNGTSCALFGYQVYCWGSSSYGATGTGKSSSLDCLGIGHYCEPPGTPVWTAPVDGGPAPTLNGVTQVYFGYSFACAITTSRALWCWGDDGAGGVSYAEPFPLYGGGTPANVTQFTSRSSGGFPGVARFALADGTYYAGSANHTVVTCP
jgi:hypothetical protein